MQQAQEAARSKGRPDRRLCVASQCGRARTEDQGKPRQSSQQPAARVLEPEDRMSARALRRPRGRATSSRHSQSGSCSSCTWCRIPTSHSPPSPSSRPSSSSPMPGAQRSTQPTTPRRKSVDAASEGARVSRRRRRLSGREWFRLPRPVVVSYAGRRDQRTSDRIQCFSHHPRVVVARWVPEVMVGVEAAGCHSDQRSCRCGIAPRGGVCRDKRGCHGGREHCAGPACSFLRSFHPRLGTCRQWLCRGTPLVSAMR